MSMMLVLNALSGAVFAAAVTWALLWALTRVMPYLRFKGAFPELVLTAPGEGARAALRAVERNLLLLAAAACALLTAVMVLLVYGSPRLTGLWMWLLFGLACALFVAWWVFLVRGFISWRRCRYAARAHLALSGALGRLAMQGHRLFHDVPLGELTLDHLVVGKLGAFAITLIARKPGKQGNVTRINGRSIEFQDGVALLDTIALAERGARALTDATAKGLSHRIHVLPVVAIPGWEIAPPQGQAGEVFLINEKSAVMLLRSAKPADHLLDEDAASLQEQLVRLCVNRKL
ncbi:MAG TPA: hypothetical protein VGT99_00835 [Gammaproteobacteria bacterium]|nr:hypothetical protein [Gammaproteobacteria bacterium]